MEKQMEDENLNDQSNGQDDLNGQQNGGDAGNDKGNGNANDSSPTEIEVKGVKIPYSEFEALAKEKFKDRFDAFDNREKWQKANTQRAEQIKQLERDARRFQQLQTDPRFSQFMQGGNQPQSKFDQIRQQFIQKATSQWGDRIDPNFLNFMGDYIAEVSGHRAQEVISPFQNQYFSEWEQNFLASHPLAEPGTDKFEELKSLISAGAKPEKAYKAVYQEELMEKEFQDRIKKRDDENRKKINNSRRSNGTVQNTRKPQSFDESFEQSWASHGGD